MIQFGVGQNHALDRHPPHGRVLDRTRWQAAKLLAYVRRRVQEEPVIAVATDGCRGLCAWNGCVWIVACKPATGAPAVPLRKPAASGGTEQTNVHARVQQTGLG